MTRCFRPRHPFLRKSCQHLYCFIGAQKRYSHRTCVFFPRKNAHCILSTQNRQTTTPRNNESDSSFDFIQQYMCSAAFENCYLNSALGKPTRITDLGEIDLLKSSLRNCLSQLVFLSAPVKSDLDSEKLPSRSCMREVASA